MRSKPMDDDEIMDMAYNRLFGDLDGIRAGSMFSDKTEGAVPNAGTPGIEGVSVEIKPLMAGAAEGEKKDDLDGNLDEEDEDRLKGIGNMSPLMAQLHGGR